jgi:hypothetical protein
MYHPQYAFGRIATIGGHCAASVPEFPVFTGVFRMMELPVFSAFYKRIAADQEPFSASMLAIYAGNIPLSHPFLFPFWSSVNFHLFPPPDS